MAAAGLPASTTIAILLPSEEDIVEAERVRSEALAEASLVQSKAEAAAMEATDAEASATLGSTVVAARLEQASQ